MSAAQDAALSFLVLQHVQDQKAREPIVVVAKAPKAQEPAPIPSKPGPVTMALPQAGTIDAKGFMVAMRKTTDRNEQIKLIAAFIGYDGRRDFGSQDSEARTKAQQALRPRPIQGLTLQEKRSAERSMAGYVAGMPDNLQRRLADLRAREVSAVEAMIQHEKAGRDMALSDADRLLADGLAQVERERLMQIRKDIAALV